MHISWFKFFFFTDWFSESGGMCAMKEVTLFSDDAKSKESAKQLMQVCSWLVGINPYDFCALLPFFSASNNYLVLKQLCIVQEITLLSRLQHPNIVQYYGSETVSSVQFYSLGLHATVWNVCKILWLIFASLILPIIQTTWNLH